MFELVCQNATQIAFTIYGRYAAPEMNSIMSFQFLTLEASLLPEHLDRLNSSVHPYSLKLPQSTRLFDMLMDSTLYGLS